MLQDVASKWPQIYFMTTFQNIQDLYQSSFSPPPQNYKNIQESVDIVCIAINVTWALVTMIQFSIQGASLLLVVQMWALIDLILEREHLLLGTGHSGCLNICM